MLPKRWIRLLEPNVYLPGSVMLLTPQLLEQYSIQGLIFDVDDTLVSSRTREMSPEVSQWLQTLKPHVKIVLVSNNLKHARIRRVAQEIDVPWCGGIFAPNRCEIQISMLRSQLKLGASEVVPMGSTSTLNIPSRLPAITSVKRRSPTIAA